MKKIRNSGFTASASVLKLVNTIQKIGKKKMIEINQAKAGQNIFPKFDVCATIAIASFHSIKLLPTIRNKKIATIFAKITAKTPVALAAPILFEENSPIR